MKPKLFFIFARPFMQMVVIGLLLGTGTSVVSESFQAALALSCGLIIAQGIFILTVNPPSHAIKLMISGQAILITIMFLTNWIHINYGAVSPQTGLLMCMSLIAAYNIERKWLYTT